MEPARFRAAFPQYGNLGDAFIKLNIERYAERRAHSDLQSIFGDKLLMSVEYEPAQILLFRRQEKGRMWYVRQCFILRKGCIFSVGLQSESRETLRGLTAQWFIQSLTFH